MQREKYITVEYIYSFRKHINTKCEVAYFIVIGPEQYVSYCIRHLIIIFL